MSATYRQKLLIFPCNGNGREAIDALDDAYDFVGFIDDTPAKQGRGPQGFPVFGRKALLDFADAQILAVPGGPSSYMHRRTVIDGLEIGPARFATIIHPAARVSRFATIGHNVLIMAGAVITSNAVIGNHVCVLPNSVVHHDTSVGDWTLIGTGVTIAGGCAIGENCYIGSGSCIINDVTVGAQALVGLSSNIIASVPAGAKMAGNPARQIGMIA